MQAMANLGLAAFAPQGPRPRVVGGLLGETPRHYLNLTLAARKLGLRSDEVVTLIKAGRLIGKLDNWHHWWARSDSVGRYVARHGRGFRGNL